MVTCVFPSLSWKFCSTPSAVIERGGSVGLCSVTHGKLVAYKNYIYVIKIFNVIALQ